MADIPYSEGYYGAAQDSYGSCYPTNGSSMGDSGSPTAGENTALLCSAPQIKPQAIPLPKVLPTPERPMMGAAENAEFPQFNPSVYGGSAYSYGGSLPRDYSNKPRTATGQVPPQHGFLPEYGPAPIRPNYMYASPRSFPDYDFHPAGYVAPPSPSSDSPRRAMPQAPRVPGKESNHHHAPSRGFDEAAGFEDVTSPGTADRFGPAYAPAGVVGYPTSATSPGFTGAHFEAGPQGYLDRRPSYDDHPQSHHAIYPPSRSSEEGAVATELPYPPPRHPQHLDVEGEVRWRDPDLHEVIEFLSHPNNIVQANAAAYLQHLSYMDDNIKQKTRILGGISPLIELLNQDIPEIQRNSCGALRNLSFGRQNEENKRAIRNAGGIPTIVRLLRKTPDNEIRELITGVLWNLSSSEDLKRPIIDDALSVLVNHIIIPQSGWDHAGEQPHDLYWSTVFRNASGVLRNISSAGEYARRKLRECEGLVDALLHLVRAAIGKNDIDNKSVENCVCTLRNLSYRCQEVDDPDYDKHLVTPFQSRAMLPIKVVGENLGCFGGSRKKKDSQNAVEKQKRDSANSVQGASRPRSDPVRGVELLWQPEVVQPYLALLSECSNPETLEAAAGSLQNLAACYWQPSIDIRAAVRKEKGLPVLVELLRMEVDRVVCAVATALRNLALDQRNKELIGKYAMKDLVQKLPNGSPQHDAGTSDDTVAAVLATLNEVVVRSVDFARSLLEAGGVERLTYITKQRGKFSPRVVKFTSQLLFNMWAHQELREVYKKAGWKEAQFITRTLVARNAVSPTTSANNTLSRPISSQGTTHYEDRTLRARELNAPGVPYSRSEDMALNDLAHALEPSADHPPPAGGVQVLPPSMSPHSPMEPVYAQVNREKKKNRQTPGGSELSSQPPLLHENQSHGPQPPEVAGDSWV